MTRPMPGIVFAVGAEPCSADGVTLRTDIRKRENERFDRVLDREMLDTLSSNAQRIVDEACGMKPEQKAYRDPAAWARHDERLTGISQRVAEQADQHMRKLLNEHLNDGRINVGWDIGKGDSWSFVHSDPEWHTTSVTRKQLRCEWNADHRPVYQLYQGEIGRLNSGYQFVKDAEGWDALAPRPSRQAHKAHEDAKNQRARRPMLAMKHASTQPAPSGYGIRKTAIASAIATTWSKS